MTKYRGPNREMYFSLVNHRLKFRTIYDRVTRSSIDAEADVDESLVKLISDAAWSLEVLRSQLFKYGAVSSLVVQSWMDLVQQASRFEVRSDLLAGLYDGAGSLSEAMQGIGVQSLPSI